MDEGRAVSLKMADLFQYRSFLIGEMHLKDVLPGNCSWTQPDAGGFCRFITTGLVSILTLSSEWFRSASPRCCRSTHKVSNSERLIHSLISSFSLKKAERFAGRERHLKSTRFLFSVNGDSWREVKEVENSEDMGK